ncbi:MAG TPA: hypothetical protein VIT38_11320 [Allosphingosinicella sp.]
MSDGNVAPAAGLKNADRGVATLGTVAGFGALFSAAACCVLPLMLAGIGVGAGGLATIIPFHWPLTIAAVAAVAVGWVLYWQKKRACARDATCTIAPPRRVTFVLLCLATTFVTISAFWSFIETPLMRLMGGA